MPRIKLNYERVVNLLQAINITLALDNELRNQQYQTTYVLKRRDEVLEEIKQELEEIQSDAG